MKFKKGDLVELSNFGKNAYRNSLANPHNMLGSIVNICDKEENVYSITVTWNNGHNSLYQEKHLELAKLSDSNTTEQAMRFNEGKSQLSYILDADVAMKGMCNVFEFGAKKYSRGNWKKGLDEKEIMDSMLRHLTAYNNGEVLDPESGLPHVDHVTCNAVFLATFGKREND